ncbi:MAG: hypothetical protein WAM44_05930 [Chthoniobacterales bacterium]
MPQNEAGWAKVQPASLFNAGNVASAAIAGNEWLWVRPYLSA